MGRVHVLARDIIYSYIVKLFFFRVAALLRCSVFNSTKVIVCDVCGRRIRFAGCVVVFCFLTVWCTKVTDVPTASRKLLSCARTKAGVRNALVCDNVDAGTAIAYLHLQLGRWLACTPADCSAVININHSLVWYLTKSRTVVASVE